MATQQLKPLPTADEVREQYPLLPSHAVEERRDGVRAILENRDDARSRLLLVIGPCSAWPSAAVERYADQMTRLQEEVDDRVLCVMRAYLQKPRTTIGWPGPLNQPDPLGSVDVAGGIWECRKMLWNIAKQLPLADEALFTHNDAHFADLLSYIALGARSAEDMEHRYVASGFDAPVGVKNPSSGDIAIAINGVESVQASHEFAYHGHHVRTSGNPHAHLVLRGGRPPNSSQVVPNYDPTSIARAHKTLLERKVRNPAIVVDASHDNSVNGTGKDPTLQLMVARSVLHGIAEGRDEYRNVVGLMIESYLKDGAQKISSAMDLDGLSITDPCLGWEKTERLVREIADMQDRRSSSSLQ